MCIEEFDDEKRHVIKMKSGWAEAFVNTSRPIRKLIKEDEDYLRNLADQHIAIIKIIMLNEFY
jgi:hypothetical protein